MVINLVSVPIIYIFFPETKGRALEDMDVLFGGHDPSVSSEHLLADGEDEDDDQGPGRRGSPIDGGLWRD